MTKKKIGELEGTPIVTGEKNYANEHEYYMTMNGDNTYQKLEQRTNGDQFRLVLGGGGSNTNPDYNVTKQTVTLFNDTIETQQAEEDLYQGVVMNVYFGFVAGETYTVVFDGTSYDIKAIPSPFQEGFVILGEIDGGPSFETYPFNIMYGEPEGIKVMMLYTNTEGSHTVEIKHEEETVITTPEFKSAVDSVTGYSISEGYETLFDGTVETEGDGDFWGMITPAITFIEGDTYKVTFNGTEYICKCFNDAGDLMIGAPHYEEEGIDWSTYPFNIVTYYIGQGQYETSLATNQEGSCTLKIEHLTSSTKTTPAFESMIQGIVGNNSGNQLKMPDQIVRRRMENDDFQVYYCLYESLEPLQSGIYLTTFNPNPGDTYYDIYQVMYDANGNYAKLLSPLIVNDGGEISIPRFNSIINGGNSGGYYLAIYDKRDEDDGFLMKIEYSEQMPG